MKVSYRSLLKQLVVTDFKLRYQGSVLGYLWSLLRPMMLFGVLFVVFTYIFPTGKNVPHFPAYLLLGIIVWTFFAEATSIGMNSIVGRGDMLRKVKISKPIIVISSILTATVNLMFNIVVVLIFMVVNKAQVDIGMLWLVIPLMLETLVLCTGLAFLLSALYVKYRDIAPIWEVLLQVLFYATPIIYPLSYVLPHHKLAVLISMNPITQIIQDLRYILITPSTITTHSVLGWPLALVPLIIVVLVFVVGVSYFMKRSKYFVENL